MSLVKFFSRPLLTHVAIQSYQTRTLKSALKIKWVRPVKKPHIHPSNSGDLQPIADLKGDNILHAFKNSKELETADENVKRIFQLDLNGVMPKLTIYRKELSDKVRRHRYDTRSHEVYIANLTAKIRFLQEYLVKFPKDTKRKVKLQHLIDRRKTQLTHLRRWDYKRFEWLLEQLDIIYRPYPDVYDQITRKKSLTQLTTLHCEELKEKKIAEYRKKVDAEKVPFLEDKIKKLKWIRETESKYGMAESISEDDIIQCQNQLEKVRLDIEANKDKDYVRTIDPYTLEVYDPKELRAAEKKEELV